MSLRLLYLTLLTAILAGFVGAKARGQFVPYSDLYKRQVRQPSTRPNVNPSRYTFDRYFYHSPAVSPYSNLMRPSGPYVNNYYQYVRPEEKRRAQIRPQSSLSPTSGFSPYKNQFYRGHK